MRLTAQDIGEILAESGVPELAAATIEASYQKEFEDDAPILEHLIDAKAVEAGNRRRQERELIQKVASLEEALDDARAAASSLDEEDGTGAVKTYDVILRVTPEKAAQIKSRLLDGQKCLVIPMDENEHAAINGVNTTV